MQILVVASCVAMLGAGCRVGGVQYGTDANPRAINLTVDGYRFIPDAIEVTVGETVRFVVTNPTDMAHEVYIGTPAEQAADEAAHASTPPMQQPKVKTQYGYGGYLAAYSTVEFRYHFANRDEVMIGCHLPGHWAKGMKAAITVRGS
ncbi:MAG: plastocyanin/azurin family copper-binding protein [Chloroflexota bacterium]|nr:plastocyanin/azurin family copper-binding protein [Chloroflexota bacterium]